MELAIERANPLDVQPWARNPRTITKARFDQLKAAMRAYPEHMDARPLAVWHGTCIAGNMRLLAACELREEGLFATIPIVRVDHLSAPEAEAWAIRDNQPYGQDQEDQMAEMMAGLMGKIDLALTGMTDADVTRLLATSGSLGDIPDPSPVELCSQCGQPLP
jgi:hypothetical protein